MKQLELFDEPEYITVEDDYSGPHGDVREDFRELVAGVPAVRAVWRCRRCKQDFHRRAPCEQHMLECEELWIELSDRGKQMTIRTANKLFETSRNIEDRMKDRRKTLEQEIADTGAEVALVEMLMDNPKLSGKDYAVLAKWDPYDNIGTYGKVPDIPLGPGIEVRHILQSKHKLTVRDDDHHKRIFVNMVGRFARYGFAGWLIPAEVENLARHRETYGHDELDKVYGLPKAMKNYRLEDLIAAL